MTQTTTQNLRGFKIETIPATNTKPEHIKITDLRFNTVVKIGYTAEGASGQIERATEYLESLGIPVTAQTWCEVNGQHQYTVLLSANFNNELK